MGRAQDPRGRRCWGVGCGVGPVWQGKNLMGFCKECRGEAGIRRIFCNNKSVACLRQLGVL